MEWLLAGLLLALPMVDNCTPARWRDPAPESLELLGGTPVNCLLVEAPAWRAELIAKAHGAGMLVLGAVASRDLAAARQALQAGVDGIAAEGPRSAEMAAWAREHGMTLVEIVPRAELRFDANVIATYEGLWAGVRIEKDQTKAQPTGGPWIETNTGFLSFVRAAARPGAPVWMAHRAPQEPQPVSRYVQAVADAASCGAKWVLDFDPEFWRRLRGGEEKGRRDWARLVEAMRFLAGHDEALRWPDAGALVLVLDERSGGLVSGGIADMISAKHIPLRIALPSQLVSLSGEVRTLLTIDPASMTAEQREAARAVARRGATLVNGPAGWKLELPPPGRITYTDEQVKQLDQIWREVNSIIGRRNYGVRVFGAPGMLTTLKQAPEDGRMALLLVNYTDYPVENITLHFPFRVQRVRMITPRGSGTPEVYETEEEGSGIDVARVEELALVTFERAAQPKR
ncbi:MAG: hypothetical protein KatS3mg004_3711 [Bryobacteraceae bacterium]|nr:MAG: hypothetical protein KatS3mg004_3711 [Bryobacteraceae bacterium]